MKHWNFSPVKNSNVSRNGRKNLTVKGANRFAYNRCNYIRRKTTNSTLLYRAKLKEDHELRQKYHAIISINKTSAVIRN